MSGMSNPEHNRTRHRNRPTHKGGKKPRRADSDRRKPDRRQAKNARKSRRADGWISLDEVCADVIWTIGHRFKYGTVYAENVDDAAGQIAKKSDIRRRLVRMALRHLCHPSQGLISQEDGKFQVVAIQKTAA